MIKFLTTKGIKSKIGLMLSNEFIAGLWCGEGYFHSYVVNKSGHKCFSTGLHMHKRELPILEEVKATLQLGNIDLRKSGNIQYRIFKTTELMHFAEKIGPLLKGNKKQQFNDWYTELLQYKTTIKNKNLVKLNLNH